MAPLLGHYRGIFNEILTSRANDHLSTTLAHQLLRFFGCFAPQVGSIFDLYLVLINLNINRTVGLPSKDDTIPSRLFKVYTKIAPTVGVTDTSS